MLWHFNLFQYVKIGLSRQELQEKLPPLNVELSTKYHLWEHSKGCAIFFVKFYEGFIWDLQNFTINTVNHDEALAQLRWVNYQIAKLQELRTAFPFCEGCEYNTKTGCLFWGQVISETEKIKTISNESQV